MSEISDILGDKGLLSSKIDGYSCRQQQLEMAEEVFKVIKSGEKLVSEAGTGTGKTFAYLVPALLSGKKVVISTGTKNLQDQLYQRDLPLIRDILAIPARMALLKGRANYLCHERLENAVLEGRMMNRKLMDELYAVRSWAGKTRTGDIVEVSNVSEDSQIWPIVTSTADNCLGAECDSYAECHLVEARRRAQEADIVVINHHLLCADFALKEGGFGELLPSADCFIVDEAHQLPDVASNFFGLSLSARQFNELASDSTSEYLKEAGEEREILNQADKLVKCVRDLRLELGVELRRAAWKEIAYETKVQAAISDLRNAVSELAVMLDAQSERGKGIESCCERALALGAQLGELCDEGDGSDIRWFETYKQSFIFHKTPLEISEQFSEQMNSHSASWIFTSATLAVNEKFGHFLQQLGLEEAQTAIWDSPFDYAKQALWFVPKGIPKPNEPNFHSVYMETILPIVKASRGRAFLLFTSHRALRATAELLEDEVDYPLFIQGDSPKTELLDKFRQAGNGVLLGTSSFWEGVDVRGDALSLVIIDRLPFASPGDPVLQARIDALRKKGGNPFRDFQLPQATIALKQGVGRLIRDETDTGVLVICDRRLLSQSYGQTFLDSLPEMARTRDINDVIAFYQNEAE